MQRREGDDSRHIEERIVDVIERLDKTSNMFATQSAIQEQTNKLMERRLDLAESAIYRIDKYITTKESYINGGWEVIKKVWLIIGFVVAAGWAVFEKFYK